MKPSITLRKGEAKDVEAAFRLITELAIFERAPDAVTNTPAKMLEDGFGERPIYEFILAESEGEVVGMSLYYIRYSTWKGKCIYLEDLIVTETQRGRGIGEALLKETAKVALAQSAALMLWQVLDWNEPAINFYKKIGASIDNEWLTCKMNREEMEKMLA